MYGEPVKCPHCGDGPDRVDYAHVETASIFLGSSDDNYSDHQITVVKNGTISQRLGRLKTVNRMREPSIEIRCKCENCGGIFFVSTMFQKGQIYSFVSIEGINR
jgi:hypothetical protein